MTQRCSVLSESCKLGPALDAPRTRPCTIQLDDYRYFLIGGQYTSSTLIFNVKTGDVEMTANMNEKR